MAAAHDAALAVRGGRCEREATLETHAQRLPNRRYSVYSVSRTCRYCGSDISRKRPQARFCSDRHRAAFRNEQNKSSHPYIIIVHRGEILAFTGQALDYARRLGAEVSHTAANLHAAGDEYLAASEVIKRVGYCRASVYAKIAAGEFPHPIVLSAPGRKRRVAWRAADVAAWLRDRQLKSGSRFVQVPTSASKSSN